MSRWEKLAQKLGHILPKTSNTTADDAARELLRQNPEKYQEYLSLLDEVYGPKEQRIADMGFDPQTWYHGSFENIKKMEPKPTKGTSPYLGKGTYVTTSPQDASNYASLNSVDNNYKIEKLAESLRDKFDLDYTSSIERAQQVITKNLDSGAVYPVKIKTSNSTSTYIDEPLSFEDAQNAVKDSDVAFMQPSMKWPSMEDVGPDDWHARLKKSEDIRSINAAFDPRFSKSKDILAGVGAAPIVSNDQLFSTPLQELSNTYHSIRQPMIDAATNAGGYIADLTNPAKPIMTPEQNQNLRETGQFIGSMAFDPINLLSGGAGLGVTAADVLTSDKSTEKTNFNDLRNRWK